MTTTLSARSLLTSTRFRAILYWATTVIIALESAVGGVWDILRIDYIKDILEPQLGYPTYLAIIIGVCKIPGAVVLVLPRLPRLKEWVYAGVFFIYSGAVASSLAVGDIPGAIGPAGFAAITMISWALRPADRRDLAPALWSRARTTLADASRKVTPRAVVYWVALATIVFVLLTGGVADLVRRGGTVDGVVAIGYPLYFVTIIGIWKLLGVAALLAPRFPRLKEWAYAGAFYNFAGAVVSHTVSGSEVQHLIWPGLFAVCTLVAWALRPPQAVGVDR